MGKYILTGEIRPEILKHGNVAFSAGDLLFDWTPIIIPAGSCLLKTATIKIQGTNAGVGNGDIDMDIYFANHIGDNVYAKTTDVVSAGPQSLGHPNAVPTVLTTQGAKPAIIGCWEVDSSDHEDTADNMLSYNVMNYGANRGKLPEIMLGQGPVILEHTSPLQHKPIYDSMNQADGALQTIYIAGFANGAFDFGTGVIIAGENAADHLTIDVDDGSGGASDAQKIFTVGDDIIAFAASDGNQPKTIGTLTAVSSTVLTVDACAETITDNHEVCNVSPIKFRFGLEY